MISPLELLLWAVVACVVAIMGGVTVGIILAIIKGILHPTPKKREVTDGTIHVHSGSTAVDAEKVLGSIKDDKGVGGW